MQKSKILVIDDDEDVLYIVTMILKNQGYEVEAFSIPPDNLIEKLNDRKPALILLDIQIAEFDGRDIGKKIKERFANLPVILFSANHHYKHGISSYMVDDFIEKPFETGAFLKTIRDHIQKQDGQFNPLSFPS